MDAAPAPLLTFDELASSYKIKTKCREGANRWLPIYPSPELAQLAAALITDGHIDWNAYDGSPRTKKFLLYSNHPEECTGFLSLVKRLFGADGKMIEYKSTTGFSKMSDSYVRKNKGALSSYHM